MNFVLSLIGSSLAKMALKILISAAGEKHLAETLFGVAKYFADKTPSPVDDKIVAWAKDMYESGAELHEEVQNANQ